MTEVALAFSNIDKPRADALARILSAVGYEVAAQPLTPEKVDRASAVLAFWSPSSINSQPVQSAASQAAYSKKLVSVRAGPADPPAAYALVTLHDLSSWTGSLDAPELRTLVSHVAKMAPPPQQQQQQPQSRGIGFAGNGFDPYGQAAPAAPRPAAREPAPSAARDTAPPREASAIPASMRDRAPRPERKVAEPRRAEGGGVARMAFGAIAVTVLGGAAVAAFNYEGFKDGGATADSDEAKTVLASAPAPVLDAPATAIEVAPSSAEATPPVVADQPVQVASNTYAAPASPAPAAPGAVSVQAPNGWTATLPTAPTTRTPTMTAQPVSAGATTRPVRPQQPARLPPITTTGPQPTDIVAIDHANLGGEDPKPATAPAPGQPERVWQRPGITYGPDNN